ncbi:MAG TPA: hypothetical protein VGH11_09355 [Jatrophihabitans sp.]
MSSLDQQHAEVGLFLSWPFEDATPPLPVFDTAQRRFRRVLRAAARWEEVVASPGSFRGMTRADFLHLPARDVDYSLRVMASTFTSRWLEVVVADGVAVTLASRALILTERIIDLCIRVRTVPEEPDVRRALLVRQATADAALAAAANAARRYFGSSHEDVEATLDSSSVQAIAGGMIFHQAADLIVPEGASVRLVSQDEAAQIVSQIRGVPTA